MSDLNWRTHLGASGRQWPRVGDVLTHRFNKSGKVVSATVVEVDKEAGRVRVRIGDDIYNSLSSAAEAVGGHSANGWVFWGLKSQLEYRKAKVGK